jgi:hypothetical protein
MPKQFDTTSDDTVPLSEILAAAADDIEVLPPAEAHPTKGRVIEDPVDGTVYIGDGASWVDVDAASGLDSGSVSTGQQSIDETDVRPAVDEPREPQGDNGLWEIGRSEYRHRPQMVMGRQNSLPSRITHTEQSFTSDTYTQIAPGLPYGPLESPSGTKPILHVWVDIESLDTDDHAWVAVTNSANGTSNPFFEYATYKGANRRLIHQQVDLSEIENGTDAQTEFLQLEVYGKTPNGTDGGILHPSSAWSIVHEVI